MATTLDATYGGRLANSYVSLADADVLIRDTVENAEAWERVQDQGNKQSIALLTATRLIDAATTWHGGRYFWNQALAFPRAVAVYEVGSTTEPDATFDATVAADEYLRQQKIAVQLACALQAVYRLAEGRDVDRDDQFRGITGSSRGHRFSESATYGRPHMVLCPDAFDLLGKYEGDPVLRRGGSTTPAGRPPIGSLP